MDSKPVLEESFFHICSKPIAVHMLCSTKKVFFHCEYLLSCQKKYIPFLWKKSEIKNQENTTFNFQLMLHKKFPQKSMS